MDDVGGILQVGDIDANARINAAVTEGVKIKGITMTVNSVPASIKKVTQKSLTERTKNSILHALRTLKNKRKSK